MLEETIGGAWTIVSSWFTPTILFVFLNLMIGTIAIASGLGTRKQTQDNPQQPHLGRPPSFLQRIKSFNLSQYTSTPHDTSSYTSTTTLQPQAQTHHLDDDFHPQSESESETETEDPFQNTEEVHKVQRTTSDTKPASGDMPLKLANKMRKSASAKSAFAHFEVDDDDDEAVRPTTVRQGKKEMEQRFGDDEEVDAKADDFINKFKNQLKLQRLQSILRYKEMLSRGAADQ